MFKIFRKAPITRESLSSPGATIIAVYPWMEYPNYSPPERFADFDVDNTCTFIYNSPLQSAGPAMEIRTVAGANAAAILREKLRLKSTFDET